MKIQVAIEGSGQHIKKALFDLDDPQHSMTVSVTELDIDVTFQGFPKRGAYEYFDVVQIAIDIGIGTSSSLLAAWLYEKVKHNKIERLSIEGQEVKKSIEDISRKLDEIIETKPKELGE